MALTLNENEQQLPVTLREFKEFESALTDSDKIRIGDGMSTRATSGKKKTHVRWFFKPSTRDIVDSAKPGLTSLVLRLPKEEYRAATSNEDKVAIVTEMMSQAVIDFMKIVQESKPGIARDRVTNGSALREDFPQFEIDDLIRLSDTLVGSPLIQELAISSKYDMEWYFSVDPRDPIVQRGNIVPVYHTWRDLFSRNWSEINFGIVPRLKTEEIIELFLPRFNINRCLNQIQTWKAWEFNKEKIVSNRRSGEGAPHAEIGILTTLMVLLKQLGDEANYKLVLKMCLELVAKDSDDLISIADKVALTAEANKVSPGSASIVTPLKKLADTITPADGFFYRHTHKSIGNDRINTLSVSKVRINGYKTFNALLREGITLVIDRREIEPLRHLGEILADPVFDTGTGSYDKLRESSSRLLEAMDSCKIVGGDVPQVNTTRLIFRPELF